MKRLLAIRALHGTFALMLVAPFPAALRAGVNELRIIEVSPATGQVEVTHTGATPFTTTSSLPFCHRFNYATVIPPNTAFEPGESKVFVVAGLNPTDSDLWLYRDFNFASAASIVTGLKYGPAPNVGRTALAASAGLWPGPNAFVPARAAGQSLQPLTFQATRCINWFSGTPNFGSFSPVQIRITRFLCTGSALLLEFTSPLPANAHRLESRAGLSPGVAWVESNPPVTGWAPNRFQITLPKPGDPHAFFRIRAGE